jgi:hypothetical protein
MPTNRSRIVGCLFISFLLGTLFLRLGDGQTDARTRLGLMFVVMGYFSFSSTNALPSVLVERDVFYRQRDAKYYKPLPYLIANILADVHTPHTPAFPHSTVSAPHIPEGQQLTLPHCHRCR